MQFIKKNMEILNLEMFQKIRLIELIFIMGSILIALKTPETLDGKVVV